MRLTAQGGRVLGQIVNASLCCSKTHGMQATRIGAA